MGQEWEAWSRDDEFLAGRLFQVQGHRAEDGQEVVHFMGREVWREAWAEVWAEELLEHTPLCSGLSAGIAQQ